MKQKLLLVKDVEDLGKKGDVVDVRAGYARNYLLPSKLALIADPHTLLRQEKLKEERAKQAVVDKKESEDLSVRLAPITLTTHVKVDPEGRMYGSVHASDILKLLEKEGFHLEKKNILLKKPIKETGVFDLTIRLKEGIEAKIKIKILPEIAKEEEIISGVVEEITKEKKETLPKGE